MNVKSRLIAVGGVAVVVAIAATTFTSLAPTPAVPVSTTSSATSRAASEAPATPATSATSRAVSTPRSTNPKPTTATPVTRKHPANRVNFGDDMIIIPGVHADVPTRKSTTENAKAATPAGASGTTNSSTQSTTGGGTTTVEEVYVSIAAVTSSGSDDVNTMSKSSVQTMISALNSYWNAQSEGAVTIELAGYETRSLNESSCDPNTVLAAEENKAFGGQFIDDAWIGTNTHLMVLTQEGCGTTAFATVGGSGGEIFSGDGTGSSEGIPYLLHEFGHNLGFEHADASICTSTKNYDDPVADFTFTSSVCPTTEYDDYLDIMGYTVNSATPNISSPQQILSGWLTAYTTLNGSTPISNVTLAALGTSSGTRAIKIVDPVGGEVYYVEYRAPVGRDATSAEFRYDEQCDGATHSYTICELGSSNNGIVRILRELPFPDAGASGTTVLATGLLTGSSDKSKRHTRLNTNQVFTNYDDGFTVTVNSLSVSAGASVTVSFAHPKTTTTTLALSQPSQTYGAASTVTATATVTSSDSSAAAGSVAFSDGTTVLGTVALGGNGTASLALPATLTAGGHAITARFTPSSPNDYATSTSTVATLTVAKATSSVAANFGTIAASPGRRSALTVSVSIAGLGLATGEVDVYVNGSRVAKGMLTATNKGTVGIQLPAFTRRGTQSVTVAYLGSPNVMASGAAPFSAIIR